LAAPPSVLPGVVERKFVALVSPADPWMTGMVPVNVIRAVATQELSRFNLDLQQLDVSAVTVNDEPATLTRDGQELQITPPVRIRRDATFNAAVTYGGVPETIVGSPIVFGSPYGFLHTPDGAFMGDEPNVTSTWIPLNDHPSDKATWTFRVTVPEGLGVVANGRLLSQRTHGGQSTFVARRPPTSSSPCRSRCLDRISTRSSRHGCTPPQTDQLVMCWPWLMAVPAPVRPWAPL
jgi:hypothetical protein